MATRPRREPVLGGLFQVRETFDLNTPAFSRVLSWNGLVPQLGDEVRGHLEVYGDQTRDSLPTERRILSTSPHESTLQGQTLLLGTDTYYLVGMPRTDYHRGRELRMKYVLHESEPLLTKPVLDLLGGEDTPETVVGGAVFDRVFDGDTQGTFVSPNINRLYISSNESVQPRVVRIDGKNFITTADNVTEAGFIRLELKELPNGAQTHENTVYATTCTVTGQPDRPFKAIELGAGILKFYHNTPLGDFKEGDTVLLALTSSLAGFRGGERVRQDNPHQGARILDVVDLYRIDLYGGALTAVHVRLPL